MSLFIRQERPRHIWCAMVVLVAVCALTVSLATRYGGPWTASSHVVSSVHGHSSVDAKRQHLTKNAATWVPPLVCFDPLGSPDFHPRIAPAGPPVPGLRLEESLYNRPPPSASSLSKEFIRLYGAAC